MNHVLEPELFKLDDLSFKTQLLPSPLYLTLFLLLRELGNFLRHSHILKIQPVSFKTLIIACFLACKILQYVLRVGYFR